MDIHVQLVKEIEEAIVEGKKSSQILAAILNHLKKAEDWGKWDMYSNDRMAKYNKKQAVDRALRLLPNAQHQLNLFVRELRDLGEDAEWKNVEDLHFERMGDSFFDNLISDWIVQQRIKGTYSSVQSSLLNVQQIVTSLKSEKTKTVELFEKLSEQKESLLTS